MKRKEILTVVIVLTIAIGAIAFSGQMQSAKQSITTTTTTSNGSPQIPTAVLYDQMFRLIINFRRKATIQKLKGERITQMKTYFKEEAQLNDQENEILEQVATEFIVAAQPIDDRAGELIAQGRRAFPDNIVPKRQIVPPPPEELATLQQQRNNLALQYRNRLSELLGSDKFKVLDSFVQGSFESNFQTVPLSAGPPRS